MARVVGVHGIAQQVKGERVLLSAWRPAPADGLIGLLSVLPSTFAM
ncbi:hypothetical protein [Streptomyces sp. MK37H]|nr:hypothetical protein [Streptomyces sp. MK37H]MBP8534652.1 hypothetical protein [Streptomyces sp. MK37H]